MLPRLFPWRLLTQREEEVQPVENDEDDRQPIAQQLDVVRGRPVLRTAQCEHRRNHERDGGEDPDLREAFAALDAGDRER